MPTAATPAGPSIQARPARFAQRVFRFAGVYGLLLMTPMYFLETRISAGQPPAITHPEFYYGFVGICVAWQLAFLAIGNDPERFRPLMPAAIFEKFGYAAAAFILWTQGRVPATALPFAAADLALGLLFAASYANLRY